MNKKILNDTYDFCLFLHEKISSCIFITPELLYILIFLLFIIIFNKLNKKILGGDNNFVIGCENRCSRTGIKYLIEKIYPDKKVIFNENKKKNKV